MSKKVPANQNDKRGYRTASEYAAQAAARIQINENGFIDIVSLLPEFRPTELTSFDLWKILRPVNIELFQNKVVHENNELRHKVVYIGSRCEQVEAELTQTKEYLNSELRKATDKTDDIIKEKV